MLLEGVDGYYMLWCIPSPRDTAPCRFWVFRCPTRDCNSNMSRWIPLEAGLAIQVGVDNADEEVMSRRNTKVGVLV